MKNHIGKFVDGALEVLVLEERKRREVAEDGSEKIVTITVESQLVYMLEQGWKPVEEIDTTLLECEEDFYSTLVEPIDKTDTIGFIYTKRLDKRLIRNKIDELKNQLSDSDYKITKCYESSLLGDELPYSIQELHRQRQSFRDKINELETLLA